MWLSTKHGVHYFVARDGRYHEMILLIAFIAIVLPCCC